MNPLLPLDKCLADPEVHVFGDRVYIFGSHDKVGGESFCLLDYEFFSDASINYPFYSFKQYNPFLLRHA